MKPRSTIRSPYFWAIVGGVVFIGAVWLGRENYQPVITGAVAPDFTATTMHGDTATLADYADKVVLLNIWATWCGPCREEMPSMQRMYESLKAGPGAEDFEIVAVSVDVPIGQRDRSGNPGGDLLAFVDQYDLTFPILHDPSGMIQRTYQATAVPESFLIGKDGLIYKKVAGQTEWDAPENQELVRRLLAY
jgi:cytochrome c biogenesis protein CcmG/thiol:disulfide interchange protein DsbE